MECLQRTSRTWESTGGGSQASPAQTPYVRQGCPMNLSHQVRALLLTTCHSLPNCGPLQRPKPLCTLGILHTPQPLIPLRFLSLFLKFLIFPHLIPLKNPPVLKTTAQLLPPSSRFPESFPLESISSCLVPKQ